MIVRPTGDPWPFPAGPVYAAPTEVVEVARRHGLGALRVPAREQPFPGPTGLLVLAAVDLGPALVGMALLAADAVPLGDALLLVAASLLVTVVGTVVVVIGGLRRRGVCHLFERGGVLARRRRVEPLLWHTVAPYERGGTLQLRNPAGRGVFTVRRADAAAAAEAIDAAEQPRIRALLAAGEVLRMGDFGITRDELLVREVRLAWADVAGLRLTRRRVVVDGPGGVELAGVRRRHVPHLRTLLAVAAERVVAAQTG